jgi:hypothetical protein
MRDIEKMPKGIFYLIHDDIKGPEIKCKYFTNPITLSQEFISKLYMSHAGFESSSLIEIKFDRYISVSCFTGNLDRRSQKEGIFGVIFEESEFCNNLDLFLFRNLDYVSNNQKDQVIKKIFVHKLLKFLDLLNILEKVEIEDIPEIFIIAGESEYKSCLLKIGNKKVSNAEMTEVYKKLMENQKISQYYYTKLNVEQFENVFLVLKIEKPIQDFEKIISIITPYFDKFFFYSLELIFLFFFPSIIRIIPFRPKITKNNIDKNNSILKKLENSENYRQEFNKLISNLTNGNIYISPLSKI